MRRSLLLTVLIMTSAVACAPAVVSEADPLLKRKALFEKHCNGDFKCLSKKVPPAGGRAIEEWLPRRSDAPSSVRTLEALMVAARASDIVREHFFQYDAIVVCGFPTEPSGQASKVQLLRIALAQELYENGLAPRIIFSGAGVKNRYTESHTMALQAARMGVPEDAVLEEPLARHTSENLLNGVLMGLDHGWHRLLFVSDRFHFYFVRRLAESGLYGGPAKYRKFDGIRTVELLLDGSCPTAATERHPYGLQRPSPMTSEKCP